MSAAGGRKPETRGERLLRELERAFRSLSPEQQRSVTGVLRQVADRPNCPSDAASESSSWIGPVSGLSCGFSTSGS